MTGPPRASSNGSSRQVSVGVVGAGFGGVGMGMKLKEAGNDAFTIFERGDTVGGVWRANTYPGAACDIPSHLYSFSFRPGHNWSRRYAPQAEIQQYLEDCVDDYGLRPHFRFGVEATRASFDAETGKWTLETDDGESHEFDVLVTACGQSTRPDIPSLAGIDDFEGRAFHSAEWDHDYDLTGKQVAVIGTGASAIQFAPAIAPRVEKLTVYQRSAPWIVAKSDREYPPWERELFRRFPPRVALSRLALSILFELGTYAFTGTDWAMRVIQTAADRERNKQLGDDPELLEKSTPDYGMGCKRVLFTSEWYPMLKRPNVELVSDGVERVTANGVVTPDGVEREADAIIWGTGFQSLNFVAPMEIRGMGGRELNEVWAGTPEAFLGTTVSGFPNLFVMYGPNTNHGSGSVPYTLECQYSYVLDAVERLRAKGLRWLDLRPEVQADWSREIQERSKRSVWITGGCNSWYLNEDGRNTNNWPGPWLEYRRRTRRLNPSHYRAAV